MSGSLARFAVALQLASLAVPAAAAPPPVPTGLSATPTAAGEVTLGWDASPGATSYRVYRSVDVPLEFNFVLGGFQLIAGTPLVATVATPGVVDSGLPPLVRQYYVVTALNADGESAIGLLPRLVKVLTAAAPDAPIFGMADLHAHQFANIGFGKGLVWGKAFDAADPPGSYDNALPFCSPVHGPGGIDDFIGNFLGGHLGHLEGGADPGHSTAFNGWPAADSYTHQQVHYRWLQRAFEGGLRLMVVHAVNNELLCRIAAPFSPTCADMPTVDEQLQAALDLEAYVDQQAGGPGLGWYRIARSATEARHLINSGKMAVVLGIEVDKLFGCGLGSSCTDADVQQGLDTYQALGVRHVFPVHVFDNDYGGAALYEDLFDYGNRLVDGAWFAKRECAPEGYGYKAAPPDFLETVAGGLLGIGTSPVTPYAAECNPRGLTALGQTLVRGLMARKMIVDIDHMSVPTADATLSIAEAIHYPGIAAGHTGAIATSAGTKASEGQRTPDQLSRIRALGGVVAPILAQGSRSEGAHPNGISQYPGGSVANDCGWSSKTFAQTYQALVDAMGGPAVAGIGFGSDFNGLAGEPGPRFGGAACRADGTPGAQSSPVGYPFQIFAPAGVQAGTLDRSFDPPRRVGDLLEIHVTDQPWDVNQDGVAHVGLLPDFVEDLRQVGLSDAQLQPLFRSAEAYVAMWERAERVNVAPPTVSYTVTPAANGSGWTTSAVLLAITASPGALPVARIEWSATGAQPAAATSVPGAAAAITISSEGTTTVTFAAVDTFGNRSSPGLVTLHVDLTAPAVACAPPDAAWHAVDVALSCAASDLTSGLANPADASFLLATAVPSGVETANASTASRSVADVAGNVTIAGPIPGNRVDRKPPAIAISVPAGGTYAVNQVVSASYACSDGGSGVAWCAGPVPSGGALATSSVGARTFTVNAADAVGNAASATASYTVAYRVCLLYDATKAKRPGSTVPVKLQLCDAGGANLSSAAVTLTATAVVLQSTQANGLLDDSGQANPDMNFRYDASLPGYIFNLSTTGLATGTWLLRFTAAGDPTVHEAPFQLR